MEDANVQIRAIKQKVKAMLNRLNELQKEREKLIQENQALTERLKERDKNIEEIQNKNLHLQISRALEKGGAGEAGLKQRLDEYIKEIDAVIAYLKD